jgi:DNA-binding NarL/FixJ family response regulator
MVVSESTVRVHIFHLLAKLKLADRNQAILYAISISSGDKTSI